MQTHVPDAELFVVGREIDDAVLAERPIVDIVESMDSADDLRGVDGDCLGECAWDKEERCEKAYWPPKSVM